MVSTAYIRGRGIPDPKASGRNKTIRVNPREEKQIQSEVAYEQTSTGSKEIFVAGFRTEPADREQAGADRGPS